MQHLHKPLKAFIVTHVSQDSGKYITFVKPYMSWLCNTNINMYWFTNNALWKEF